MEYNIETSKLVHQSRKKNGTLIQTLYKTESEEYFLHETNAGIPIFKSLDKKKAFSWLMHSCTNKVTYKTITP